MLVSRRTDIVLLVPYFHVRPEYVVRRPSGNVWPIADKGIVYLQR
jgi:hypothetical protein